jgi:hypothetical protein
MLILLFPIGCGFCGFRLFYTTLRTVQLHINITQAKPLAASRLHRSILHPYVRRLIVHIAPQFPMASPRAFEDEEGSASSLALFSIGAGQRHPIFRDEIAAIAIDADQFGHEIETGLGATGLVALEIGEDGINAFGGWRSVGHQPGIGFVQLAHLIDPACFIKGRPFPPMGFNGGLGPSAIIRAIIRLAKGGRCDEKNEKEQYLFHGLIMAHNCGDARPVFMAILHA